MSAIYGLTRPLVKMAIIVSVLSLWPIVASAELPAGIGFQWLCTMRYIGGDGQPSRVMTGRIFQYTHGLFSPEGLTQDIIGRKAEEYRPTAVRIAGEKFPPLDASERERSVRCVLDRPNGQALPNEEFNYHCDIPGATVEPGVPRC